MYIFFTLIECSLASRLPDSVKNMYFLYVLKFIKADMMSLSSLTIFCMLASRFL